jgi:capsular exopolysaccharide synthesis family protein
MESILNIFEQQERREPAREPALAPVRTITGDPGDQLVSLLTSESFEANKYRVLRHRIEETRAGGGRGVIAVTSSGAGEGKTTTAINLAGTLAQAKGARVLLVDADLRLPDVAAQLGIRDTGQPGLADAILDARLPIEAVVCRRPPYSLSLLTAGRHLDAPYEALRSPRLGDLLGQARRAYDYIIVDTPPVLPVPDCRVIARWADSLLLVVAAHRTPRRFLEEALNALDPDKIAGLVFNYVDPPRPGPYAYYRGYGAPPAH